MSVGTSSGKTGGESRHFTGALIPLPPTFVEGRVLHPTFAGGTRMRERELGRKSGRFTNPFVLTGPVRTFWKKGNPLLLLFLLIY